MRLPAICLSLFVTAGVALGARPVPPAPAPGVLIFAAASLQTALDELTPVLSRASGASVRNSYAASSTLAQQIEHGAPADVFVSADTDWMDYLAARHLIREASRVNLVGNRLVLIAPAASALSLHLAPHAGLRAALAGGRLALADPQTVPAGKYARSALQALGIWDELAGSVAPAENVRAALALVARAEAPLGIVYETDAKAEAKVRVVDRFDPAWYPPIVYPAALTNSAGPEAVKALEALRAAPARAVFERLGFQMIGQ